MKSTFDNISTGLTPSGEGYAATVGDRSVFVEVLYSGNGIIDLIIDGQRVKAYISSDGSKRWVTVNGRTYLLTKSPGARPGGAGHGHAGELAAPMPGQVRAVNVSEGDAVTKGQTLLVIEAMKMEIRIQAPFDGVVESISVSTGQTVEREQILVKMNHG
jgi:biotin carboxyl carrier protein